MAMKTYEPGTVIIREGESGNTIYQVMTGKVETVIGFGTENARKLNDIGPGSYFGELAALGGFPRTATVVAGESGATLSEFTEKSMMEVFRENPQTILTLMQQIGRRIAQLSADNDEVLKTVSALKSAASDAVSPSLLDRAKTMVDYFFGKGRDKGKPSVEEVLESKAGVSLSEGFSEYVFSCDAGSVIYRENDSAACMYAIHSGSVNVYTGWETDDQRLATTLHTNDFFGEIGMLCNVPRTATIVAAQDDTTLEIIKPEDLAELFRENPAKVWMIMDHLIRRLRSLTKEYITACQELCDLKK